MKAYVEITRSNRAAYRQPFTGSKISLGRASHCDIRLPEESGLQAEHLFIIPYESGCQVELSIQAGVPYIYEGQLLRSGMIPWGEEIYLNTIRLRMVRESSRPDQASIRSRLVLLALPLLCAVAWLLLTRSPRDDSHASNNVVASPLFEQPVECTQPNRALLRAREAERAAFAKMERYPFDHRDGVEAVGLISEARDCYQIEEETAHVTRVQKTLDTWRRRLEGDYRNYRLRLRLALSDAQYEKARRSARILRNLLSHRDDSYTKWLGRVERNPDIY